MSGNPADAFFEGRAQQQQYEMNQLAYQQSQIKVQQQRAMMEKMQQLQQGQQPSQPGQSSQPGQPGQPPGQPQVQQPTPLNLADQMDQFAQIAASTGNLDTATQLATKSSVIRKNNATAEEHKLKSQMQDLNLTAGLLEDVKDQESWQQANMIYMTQTGKESPYAKMPYNQQFIDQLKNAVGTAKEKAQIAKDKALTDAADARVKVSEVEIPLKQAQTRLADARAAAAGKAGGINTKSLASDTSAAVDLINRDFRGVSPEEARIFGRQIAERTRELMSQNPALHRSEAVAKAYQEKRQAGVFAPYGESKGRGGTFANPLPIPEDKTKLVKDRYYANAKGQKARWTGKGFAILAPTEGTDDEEEESDDE